MACILCSAELTENNSTKEHIIPNSVGGRKKVTGFICRMCNSITGDSWDAELAKQLNSLSLICNISRERGTLPPAHIKTTEGETVKYFAGGVVTKDRSYVSEEREGENISISIQAKDKKDLKKILKQKKKKYPKLDLEKALAQIEETSSVPEGMYHFQLNFGNELLMKSIAKSMLATVFDAGISPHCCDIGLAFLKGNTKEIPLGYFYERDFIRNRPKGMPLHCIYVKASSHDARITGYVEFFGAYRMVSLLSSDYTGQDFEHYYAINPVSGNNLDELDIILDVNNEEIQKAYAYQATPEGCMEQVFLDVIAHAQASNFKNERERILSSAVDKGFEICGAKEGEILTEEHMKIITNTILNELDPILQYQSGVHRPTKK